MKIFAHNLFRSYNICKFAPMNQIEQLILHALTTTNDNNLRSQAEREIFQLLGSNPAEMFYTCAKIVGDNSKNTQVRQSTASIIKILLTQKVDLF